jgi:chaperonin GroES
MKLHPLADVIIAEQIKAAEKTESGFYLSEGAREQPNLAKVVSVGSKISTVKVDDTILYTTKYESRVEKHTIDKTEYVFLKEDDVIATVV